MDQSFYHAANHIELLLGALIGTIAGHHSTLLIRTHRGAVICGLACAHVLLNENGTNHQDDDKQNNDLYEIKVKKHPNEGCDTRGSKILHV